MTDDEVDELDASIRIRVEDRMAPIKRELASLMQQRVLWYQAGYIKGTQDDPEQLRHGHKTNLAERAFMAAAQYLIDNSK